MRVAFGAVVVWNLSYIAGFLGLVYIIVRSHANKDSLMLGLSGAVLVVYIVASLLLAMRSYDLAGKKTD